MTIDIISASAESLNEDAVGQKKETIVPDSRSTLSVPCFQMLEQGIPAVGYHHQNDNDTTSIDYPRPDLVSGRNNSPINTTTRLVTDSRTCWTALLLCLGACILVGGVIWLLSHVDGPQWLGKQLMLLRRTRHR
jgi:hypothetical protein